MNQGKVVTVDGETGRLIPLVERGPQRRKGAGFEDGEAVTVTLSGIYRKDGAALVSLVIEGPRRGLQEDAPALVPVVANGKTMLSIDPAQITRKADRRSGAERRKGR